MEELQITAAIIAGFILRIGIPIALTFLLGSFLRRLDTRWREEAEQQVMERKLSSQKESLLNLWLDQPCYTIKNCTSEEKETCQAYAQSEKPCWDVYKANGNLTQRCQECQYRKELFFAVGHENRS
jgi:H+/gluconate symporter-like permease